jgi:putative tryptophan/tyrosine transport system substrate-binding protein
VSWCLICHAISSAAQLNVDVIVVPGGPVLVGAAREATSSIPIVAHDLESDPLANGWIKTLARPGGNLTGFFLDIPEMSGKQLGLLREVLPRLSRVAVLGSLASTRCNSRQLKRLQRLSGSKLKF